MKQKKMTLKEKILLWWATIAPTYDPFPVVPPMSIWEVQVDQNIIRIEASSRITALIKAKCKYPNAKNIRVIRRINFREAAEEIFRKK